MILPAQLYNTVERGTPLQRRSFVYIQWIFVPNLLIYKIRSPVKSNIILNAMIICRFEVIHYRDVMMSTMTFQITGISIVCSTVCSGADQRKHQSSASLAIVRGIHRWSVNSPHKGPVTRKMFPFDDVIMALSITLLVPVISVHQVHNRMLEERAPPATVRSAGNSIRN